MKVGQTQKFLYTTSSMTSYPTAKLVVLRTFFAQSDNNSCAHCTCIRTSEDFARGGYSYCVWLECPTFCFREYLGTQKTIMVSSLRMRTVALLLFVYLKVFVRSQECTIPGLLPHVQDEMLLNENMYLTTLNGYFRQMTGQDIGRELQR